MSWGAESVVLVVAGGVALVLLVLLLAVLVDRRRLRDDLSRSREELAGMAGRIEALERAKAEASPPPTTDFVITSVGEAGSPDRSRPPVSDRAVLSATVGEPLVKVSAFVYGVRRALSAENRNRIAFEVRREVRRARKERRRFAKEAVREAHRQQEAA